MTDQQAPDIDLDIYPMPAFVTFTVPDLVASTRWYEAAGFVVLATLPGPGGDAGVVHLRRQRYQDILLVPGEADPAGACRVTMATGGEDVDARADLLRARADLGGSVDGPRDTPWFTCDLDLVDPDGYRVTLTSPRLEEMHADTEWVRTVHESAGKRPE